MNSVIKKKREVGLDYLKIVASFLIVCLHTIDGRLGVINRILQLATVISIPAFFAVNGYLLLDKESALKWKYSLQRIFKILRICFFWELLHAIISFVVMGEIRNFVLSFFMDFIQQGLFYHFWFFGALIILYAIMPLLSKMLTCNYKLYVMILMGLMIACISVDALQYILKSTFVDYIPQTFRLWIWIFYFMLGGVIKKNKKRIIEHYVPKWLQLTTIFGAFSILFVWMMITRIAYNRLYVAALYGGIPTIVCVSIAIVTAIRIKNNRDFSNNIIYAVISRTPMGIYIFHPFVLSVFVHFFPAMGIDSVYNLCFSLITFLTSLTISYLLSQIPLFKYFVNM